MNDFISQLKAHLTRTESALDLLDAQIDRAVAIVETAANSTSTLRARLEFVLCIFPLAPLDKIAACLAGGGLVAAIIGTKLEWTTSALRATGGVRGVRVEACSPASATVTSGSVTETLAEPGKKILAVFLFWVGA